MRKDDVLIKEDGFAVLECIISLFIVSVITSIIVFSIHNNIVLTKKNRENFKMIQLSRKLTEDTRNEIKSSDNTYPYDKEEQIENFKVHTTVNKTKYYNCYNLKICISNGNNNMEVNTYVTKRE